MSTRFVTTVRSALLASSALLLPQTALAQDEVETDQTAAEDENTIVVSGFRESLNAAVAAKRASDSQIDVIVAEDIAKFPDTNLAESLQRIPGVAIQRDAGEGRAITVRGLGPQFPRVRVNGMEAIATSTDGAAANRERGFDFNVFASELFSSIVVHKTAEASLDEGSLGAVVDLNTGNPLAYDPGFGFVASAQARYHHLSEDLRPREGLGSPASAQWEPTERTKLSIDGLYSTFKETRDEYWGEVLFRGNERLIDVVDYTLDSNNNMITGTFNNAHVRTER